MKPTYHQVRRHYPRGESLEKLYTSLGWKDLVGHKAYKDTCAIRMSYALVSAGVTLPGAQMRVQSGDLKGRYLAHRQESLSRTLKHIWGAPEVYKSKPDAEAGIGSRSGVVSFFKIEGGNGGHIDLVTPDGNGFLECARSCYFTARTIWFWPL
jgi:hypothetical protein